MRGWVKDVENRLWERAPWYLREFRGPFLIHAAGGMTHAEYDAAREFAAEIHPSIAEAMPAFDDLPRGGIVGAARVVDCVRESDSRWFERIPGNCGLVLHDMDPRPFVPCKGALGWFDVPT